MFQVRKKIMQSGQDYEKQIGENNEFSCAFQMVIGDRSEQQDNFGYVLYPNEGLIVICDGMGGINGGKRASEAAVSSIIAEYTANRLNDDVSGFLTEAAIHASTVVHDLKDETGKLLGAGSTMVAIVIKNRKLYWNSVGDSRAYLMRDGQYIQLTTDHTYRTVLNGQLKEGMIGQEKFSRENSGRQAEALLSYLGSVPLELIDFNEEPIDLQSGDRLILMTDGLYKYVEEKIVSGILENFHSLEDSLQALEMQASRISHKEERPRDNMTVAIIQMK